MFKNVSAVIESDQTEALLDGERNAELGIEDEQFAAPSRYSNKSARGRI